MSPTHKMKQIYFDNAATTSILPEVVDAMHLTMKECYGNPSSTHAAGRAAKAKVESARKYIAQQVGALPQEIIFTSGGTEGDNTVLQCAFHMGIQHVISSPIEHHAVLHPLQHLAAKKTIHVHWVKVLPNGLPDMQDLQWLLESIPEKKLVSLMHVNNEVGSILDLAAVGKLCHDNNALFHSDTVQSVGHFPVHFGNLPIDFAVAAAHKFHGPKGVGFMYVRKKAGLNPLLLGGSQERGLRAGTESVHNIVGMETALRMCCESMDETTQQLKVLKTYFLHQLKDALPETTFNGMCDDLENSTHTIINARLPINEKKAELLAFHLDLQGICCSKGSACQSGSTTGSHVLNALLSEEENKFPSLRFSFSIHNTKEEVDKAVSVLAAYANS